MKRLLVIFTLLLSLSLILAGCNGGDPADTGTEGDLISAFAVSQVNEDQKVSVSWESDPALTKIEIEIKHGDMSVAKTTVEGEALANKEVTLDAYYGKHTVNIKATAEGGKSLSISKEVAVSASEYVIAPISGSMPQLYFTLYMNEINNNGSIPTFVWLARPESWNWDKLPENVYAMPTVDRSEVLVHNNYARMESVTDKYIEELYSINPDSKFNLYINDYNAYLYLRLLVANGIPEENYYVTLLSDGGASYSGFNETFDSTDENFDADAKYAEVAESLETLYSQVREKKDYYSTSDGTFCIHAANLRKLCYVAAREKDNVEWWILRPRAGVLCSPDEDFIARVLGDDCTEGIIEERNFAKPLQSMSEEEKNTLKEFYNFNGEMFEAAEKQNKKAMMILGSWAYAANEPDFDDYVKLVKAYYGDEFVYYYKGHPNTPTSNHPDKQAQLDRLGLIDVESSINAELILFFYPDIYMCGYNSSTFLSVESYEMACAMFNVPKSSGSYSDLIGMYLTKITDPASGEYAELCTEENHTYYLMEFNKDESHGADIGIFDATDGSIKYYTVTADGQFQEKQ